MSDVVPRPRASARGDSRAPDLEPVEPRALERQRSLRKDYLPDLRRAVVLGKIGVAVWPVFVLYDLIQTRWLNEGNFRVLFALRVLGEAILLLGVLALGRTPTITHHQFHVVKAWVMCGFSATLAGMCLATDGLASIYVAGNMGVVLAAVFVPQPFTKAMGTIYLTLAAHPLVLTIGTLVDPALRAQLHDPLVVGRLMQYAFVLVFLGLAVAGFSHVFYQMRRELHEARGIGRYKLRRLIGSGGMSEVWTAYHTGLERNVALKILRPVMEHDADAKTRFNREVRATATLTHPNTIRVFDFGSTEDGLLYYAMELLEGENVAAFVRARGPLPVGRAIHLAYQASSALAEAHAFGIVHRDVKPENLFVTHGGLEPDFLKVLDFGIALFEQPGTVDGDRTIAGSATTISPEVVRGDPATPASDVYGMGVVLYFLLTGVYPFEVEKGGAPPTRAQAVIPPHVRRGEALPRELEELVLACLSPHPRTRPANGQALADALAELAARHPWKPRVDVPLTERNGVRPAPRTDLVVVPTGEETAEERTTAEGPKRGFAR
ncbi:MAG: serine/threonine-protein kinase [Polyangiales bacterium]